MKETQRAYTKGPEIPQYGPSWHDVNTMLEELEKDVGIPLVFHVKQVRSVAGKKGLYARLYVGECLVEGLGEGYGPSHPDGARTFPAALYNLLFKFTEVRAELTPLERASRWNELLPDNEA